MEKKVLIIGSTVADVIVNLDHIPVTAEDINVDSQKVSLGGCAYNVSGIVRQFQVPHILYSPVGRGIYGDFVAGELEKKGLVSALPRPAEENGCCYCFVEVGGERTFVCHHGAEYIFKKEWFDALDTDSIGLAYICGLEIEDKTGDVIVSFLEENPHIKVVFAPGPRINFIPDNLMERIFKLKPLVHLNDKEILEYTGKNTLAEGAKALYDMTGDALVITHGAEGAYYYDESGLVHSPAFTVDRVVDTIGAGDSHCGTILASLAMGYSMDEALSRANKVASLVVQSKGAALDDKIFEKNFR